KGGWRYEPLEEDGVELADSRLRRRHASLSHRRRSPKPARRTSPAAGRGRRDPHYPLGCTVRHAKFGEGTVLAVDGAGTERKIVVHFLNYGRKTMMEKYAGLERV
ncbi:MAG: hypothetical protein ACE5HB_08800, partial [Terriglobia bacterium]